LLFTPDSLQAIKVPIQLWASELGGDGVTPDMVAAVDSGLPVKHEYQVVPNSGHFAFLAPCPSALATARPEICKDAPGFDRGAFHRQLVTDVLAFFRAQFGGR
jgi:predicted dienelactone hydrolase